MESVAWGKLRFLCKSKQKIWTTWNILQISKLEYWGWFWKINPTWSGWHRFGSLPNGKMTGCSVCSGRGPVVHNWTGRMVLGEQAMNRFDSVPARPQGLKAAQTRLPVTDIGAAWICDSTRQRPWRPQGCEGEKMLIWWSKIMTQKWTLLDPTPQKLSMRMIYNFNNQVGWGRGASHPWPLSIAWRVGVLRHDADVHSQRKWMFLLNWIHQLTLLTNLRWKNTSALLSQSINLAAIVWRICKQYVYK